MNTDQLLVVNHLVKHFDISGGFLDRLAIRNWKPTLTKTIVQAVNNVSFTVSKGETLSVVGESGCGKSTLARVILGLYPPESGTIYYNGHRIDNLSPTEMLPFRRKMQMIFQDPYASLNPRMNVRQILEEPVRFHFPHLTSAEVTERVYHIMEQVGVHKRSYHQYPHEFSGGQRQRISIARALMVNPEFIVADEPISALDVSIQAQILNLLMESQEKFGLTYLFITHDLSVVKHISTQVAVMYLGTICEIGLTYDLFNFPRHPYTRILLSAIPKLGQSRKFKVNITGEVPTPIDLPSGCVFHGRCPYMTDRCKHEIPKLLPIESSRQIACHGVEEGRID